MVARAEHEIFWINSKIILGHKRPTVANLLSLASSLTIRQGRFLSFTRKVELFLCSGNVSNDRLNQTLKNAFLEDRESIGNPLH